jgi:single-strand DNA-binding protein
MNNYNFTANLGKDAEQRFTQAGDSIVQFSAAVTSGFGDKAITTWLNCNLWGKRGESVLPYLKKGQQVAVSGELTNRPWTDKAGVEKHSLEVRVNDLTLIGGKSDARQPAQSKPETNEQKTSGFDDFEEVPF